MGIISIIPIFLSNTFAAKYEITNYVIIQLSLFWLLFKFKEDRFKFLLSPSFLAVTYLNLNFIIGSWVFSNNLVFTRLLPDYKLWEHASSRLFIFNILNFFIILSYFVTLNLKFSLKQQINLNKINQKFLFYTTVFLFITLLILSPYLEFLGFLLVVFKTALALILIAYAFKKFKLKYRIMLYFVILLIFVIFSVESKREAIFLILPIVLLETSKLKLRFKFKQIFILFALALGLCYFIITMSILRNYGGFKAKSFLEATTYVDDYIQTKTFVAGFMNNLEISTTYLHSNNAIEYLKKDKLDLVYGETIIKPIFIFIPRSYFKFKPRSAIDIYTSEYDIEFRNRGGSFPISMQSELYLNFGYLSFIFGFIIFTFFNSVYKNALKLIKNNEILNYIYLLYMYEIFLFVIRGSGLDIFSVYSIVFIIFFICFKLFLKIVYALTKT
ncbi:hypothetical protein BWR22_00805 [Lacinutrix venerupis]|uniref:Oligosaccharide repeat unit polymerase n=2 Tax=Lacinutrix venerupis TaxID=1486034 RepID=A0AAC9LIX6_9FLAO|nr:hypothetical protein BWR22_00805 [Lacinutrix venerupis]